MEPRPKRAMNRMASGVTSRVATRRTFGFNELVVDREESRTPSSHVTGERAVGISPRCRGERDRKPRHRAPTITPRFHPTRVTWATPGEPIVSIMKSNGSPRPTSPVTRVVVAFELTDTGESFHVAARNGVTTVLPGRPGEADATVRLPQRVWIELLLGLTSLGDALLADGVDAEGDLAEFVRFHRRFTTSTAERAVGVTQASEPDSEGEIQ
jgi:hypothetical protein